MLEVHDDSSVGHQAGLTLIVEHRHTFADRRHGAFSLQIYPGCSIARTEARERPVIRRPRLLAGARHHTGEGGKFVALAAARALAP